MLFLLASLVFLSSCSKYETTKSIVYNDSECFFYGNKRYYFEENACYLFDSQNKIAVSLTVFKNFFVISMLDKEKTIKIPFEKGKPNLGKIYCYFCNSKILVRNDENDFASFYIIDLINQTCVLIDIKDIEKYRICNFSLSGILLYSIDHHCSVLINIDSGETKFLQNQNKNFCVIRGQDFLVESRFGYIYLINMLTKEEIYTGIKMKISNEEPFSNRFFYYDGENLYYARKNYFFILKNFLSYMSVSLLPNSILYPIEWNKKNLLTNQNYKLKLESNFAVLLGTYP